MIAATTDGGTGADTGPETGLARARRLVVKIGSATLVDEESGQLRRAWLDALADDLAACRSRGQEVVVVTSGAVAVGREYLGLGPAGQGRPLRLEEKQAAAATGQSRLIHAYQDALGRHGLTVAQILLTLGDTEARRRHLNARATIDTLLRLGAVPVINENDSVATAEIRFGDNDRLAARVAQMISADTLVLLSDIDGLHTADPRRDNTARLIPVVRELTAEIEAMAGNPLPGHGSGGMVTKIAAARIALAAGCRMVIARGERMNPLAALDLPAAEGDTPSATGGTPSGQGGTPSGQGGTPSGQGGTPSGRRGTPCTWFLPSAEPLTARKRWIAGHLNIVGTLTVDAGALQALLQGRSLLPAGVTALAGAFERGDAVAVLGPDGREIARGLCAYGSADAQRIIGRRSAAIAELLGYRGRDEMIHRDDLVLT